MIDGSKASVSIHLPSTTYLTSWLFAPSPIPTLHPVQVEEGVGVLVLIKNLSKIGEWKQGSRIE